MTYLAVKALKGPAIKDQGIALGVDVIRPSALKGRSSVKNAD